MQQEKEAKALWYASQEDFRPAVRDPEKALGGELGAFLSSLADRHVAAPAGIGKVPEPSGVFRGVAALGVVAVRGAAFYEVHPVATGRLKPIQARAIPAQPAGI